MAIFANPPDPAPAGLFETIEAAGHSAAIEWNAARTGVVWQCDDAAAVQAIVVGYSGSAAELAWWKSKMQAALDDLLDDNFDLKAFIRAGASISVTAAGIGNFLATINNNYRTLRASIAAASTVAAVQAVNINAGWPANP